MVLPENLVQHHRHHEVMLPSKRIGTPAIVDTSAFGRSSLGPQQAKCDKALRYPSLNTRRQQAHPRLGSLQIPRPGFA